MSAWTKMVTVNSPKSVRPVCLHRGVESSSFALLTPLARM